MEWLNYHHLLYFWLVAREGSITKACKVLGLAPSTVSEQIQRLEDSFDQQLFRRDGRRLILTDVGQVTYRYAEEIFSVGAELQDYLRGRPVGGPIRLDVGIADVLPKLVAIRLLEPALQIPERIHLVCREDRPEELLGGLILHQLDVMLTDAPVQSESHIRVFNHLLGECGVLIFAAPEVAQLYREDFPKSIDGAPFLMPTVESMLRRNLNTWFNALDLHPVIVAEFEDSALLKVFGQRGHGLFAAPAIVAEDIVTQYGVEILGEVEGARESFYAVSVERKLEHPAVVAISDAAHNDLFNDNT